jgi:NAD(P)-dependent dehydrogenase (short-subunit alcohol dehydrogenase family)
MAASVASKVAVVFGCTGNVGPGIALSFLQKGYTVAMPVRSVAKLDSSLPARTYVHG